MPLIYHQKLKFKKMKINWKKLLKRLLILIPLMVIITWFIGNKLVKNHGFESLGEFISNYNKNKNLAKLHQPETVKINLSQADYNFLKEKRDEALNRGIQINIGDNYVPCDISINDDKIQGELRLKGHMTDHLQGDKWSFRVKTSQEFMGMYRFSLQHPGTRHYVNEWVYHELLKNEGIIHLQYDFIHLELNEKDLGIYAIEEHFGQHVLARNNRPNGAILRWNPELYWEGRIDEFQNKYLDQQYAHYFNSYVEPYDKGVVLDDSTLLKNYLKGSLQLELFRRGELTTSQAFDVEKMAAFHAIIDLVGGHHSLDWSDVKYYYNDSTKKIEPVGYESFSIRKTESIAGQQLPEKFNGIESDYHERLFADPIFFEAYIKALERIANENYLKSFASLISDKLNEKLGFLAHEFAYIQFSWEPYYENIELIRHNLELPKAVHPFLQTYNDTLIQLVVNPVSDFPIEIVSLDVNEKRTFTPKNRTIIPAKSRNEFGQSFPVLFPNNGKKVKDLILNCKIPGSQVVFQVIVAEYPYSSVYNTLDTLNSQKLAYTPQNILVIDKPYIINEKDNLVLHALDSIIFTEKGKLLVNGTLSIIGTEDRLISLNFKNNSSPKIIVNGGRLMMENTRIKDGQEIISVNNSSLKIHQTEIIGGQDLLKIIHSEITLSSLKLFEVDRFIHSERSLINASGIIAQSSSEVFNSITDEIVISHSSFNAVNNIAVLNFASKYRSYYSSYSNSDIIVTLDDASFVHMGSDELLNIKTAFRKDENSTFTFASDYNLYNTTQTNISRIEG